MPRQQGIFGIRASKENSKLTVTPRGISFYSSSNNKPSSPPYRVGIKIKAAPEEKSNEELPAGILDDSFYSPLVIDDDLKMGDMTSLWIDFENIYWW